MSIASAWRMGVAWVVVGTMAGCSTGMGGRGWIPNAPGDVPAEKEEVARKAPPAARPAPSQASVPSQPSTSPFRAPPAGSAPAPAAPAPAVSAPAPAPGSGPIPAASTNPGAYTQATRYGDLLFLSGQIAVDPRTNQMMGDKVEDQTRQVMENIRQVLEANRLTMANVVSVTVYMKDINQFRAMDDVYDGFFKGALPARTVVEASRLPRGALVQISVIAGR